MVLLWMIYLGGLLFFVVRPLYFEPLSNEHRRSTYDANQSLVPVAFQPGIEQPNFHRRLELEMHADLDGEQADSIRFMLATYGTTIPVKQVKLSSGDGLCVFANASITVLSDNAYVQLNRESCNLPKLAANTKFVLDIVTAMADQNIAAWASPKASSHDQQGLRINRDDKTFFPVGGFGSAIQPLKNRVSIMEKVWADQWPGGTLTLILFAIAFFPLLFFLKLPSPLANGLLVFLSVLAFSTLYTLISPPLQAPDEADHYISYANLNQMPQLSDEILVALNRSHYDRVFCHDGERIDSYDVLHPLQASWPAHAPILNVPERSFMGAYLWRFYHKWIGPAPALRILYETRLFNALIIASVLAVLCGLLSFRQTLFLGLLPFLAASSIPTFWFFSSHLSNHTLIVLGYIGFLAVALNLLAGSGFRWSIVGFGLVLLLISILSGRAAMPSLVAMGLLLTVGVIAEEKAWRSYLASLLLLVGLSAGLFFELKETAYLLSIMRQITDFSGGHRAIIALGLGAAALGIFLLRWACQKLILIPADKRRIDLLLTWMCLGIWLVLLVLPQIKILHLDNIEFTEKPRLLSYLKRTMLVLVTNLGIGGDDFLVIRTLWGGFGCPDNFFSQRIIDALKFLMLTGWLLAALEAIRIRDFRTLLKNALILLVGAGYFVLLSFLCWSMSATVVGRYNVGFVLVLLSVAGFGWYRGLSRLALHFRWSERVLAFMAYVGLALVTFLSLQQLLWRYYG